MTNQEGATISSLLVGLSIIKIVNKYKLNIDQDFQIELKLIFVLNYLSIVLMEIVFSVATQT